MATSNSDRPHDVDVQGFTSGRRRRGAREEKLLPSGLGKRLAIFERGAAVSVKSLKDKKLRAQMKRKEEKMRKAAVEAAQAVVLLPEQSGFVEAEGMEQTYKFSQEEIVQHVDKLSANKVFNLELDTFGPYAIRYSASGRHLVLGGRKGHVATFDWQHGRLSCELQLAESVRDVQWLQNNSLFAVAQKRYVYIYDNKGTEIHLLKHHVDPLRLDFLRHHFLLVSVGNAGFLKYQDVSTGQLVAQHRTKLGPCHVLRQNPYNAVCHLGHGNGTVTLWSPTMTTPLVTQLCHRGPVLDIAIDVSGTYMASSGMDGQMKIWDIRNFKDTPLFEYFTHTPATTLDLSQRGLLAAAYGPHVQIWKDALRVKQQSPYLTHMLPGHSVHAVRYAPFEDVLGIGHSEGFSSILVPGAGEPNFDSSEANPVESRSQRREGEVKALLEKVPPELITLDPDAVLRLRPSTAKGPKEAEAAAAKGPTDAATAAAASATEPKHKKRGKSSSLRRYLRKNSNIIDGKREALKRKLEREREAQARARLKQPDAPRTALDRFQPKEQ